MEGKTTIGSNALGQVILKSAGMIGEINGYKEQIESLLVKRKNQPPRISIAGMPGEQPYNKLVQEKQKVKKYNNNARLQGKISPLQHCARVL